MCVCVSVDVCVCLACSKVLINDSHYINGCSYPEIWLGGMIISEQNKKYNKPAYTYILF